MHRKVSVEGQPYDLERAARVLIGPDVRITLEGGTAYLETSAISQAADAGTARASAELLLRELSGLLRLEFELTAPLGAGSVVEIRADGSPMTTAFASVAAAASIVPVPAIHAGSAPPQPRPIDVALTKLSDPKVAFVGQLLAEPTSWLSLCKVIDAIADTEGGMEQLKQRGWIPATTIERITLTGNAYETALEGGRHAKVAFSLAKAKASTIPLNDALAAVKGLVGEWIRSRP